MTHTTDQGARATYRRGGIIPRADRWPDPWTDWWRLVALVLALALAAGAAVYSATRPEPVAVDCPGGGTGDELFRAGGECVGITGGAHDFGLPGVAPIMARIRQQNEEAATACGPERTEPPVTVGVVVTLNSPRSGSRSLHELEGFAAGQARVNRPVAGGGNPDLPTFCVRAVRLRVAQSGKDEQAAPELARRLRADPAVVAVVGLGLSGARAAEAADELGRQAEGPAPVPMVSDLITAEGFDSNGDPSPALRDCAVDGKVTHDVGNGRFHRISFANDAQVARLTGYLGTAAPHYLATTTDKTDPYPCTASSRVEEAYRDRGVTPVRFSEGSSTSVEDATRAVCYDSRAVTNDPVIVYTARSLDLVRFLDNLSSALRDNLCPKSSVTVLATSDAARMRAGESNANNEASRLNVLRSGAFVQGRLRLVYTPLADPDPHPDSLAGPEMAELRGLFDRFGFARADLDSGWAVTAYDSLLVVSRTFAPTSEGRTPERDVVNTRLTDWTLQNRSFAGASGTIDFDQFGNRSATRDEVTGKRVPLVPLRRLCSDAGGAVWSVPADRSGTAAACPPPPP